jgi:hypothetical protein
MSKELLLFYGKKQKLSIGHSFVSALQSIISR